MPRLFTALALPDALRDALAGLRTGIPGARWLEPEQLHLTLRFVGEVDGAQARDVLAALAQVDSPAFDVALQGVGQFGDKHPHTLWAGVAPSEPLLRLAAKIEQALQRAGFPPETRRYTPHVTLARLRSPSPARVAEFLSAQGLFRAPPFRAHEFVLFSSHLGQGGPIYTAEAHIALRASGAQPSFGPPFSPA